MIKREEYLKELISFKDKELIKVVTGIRRCGKSTLFELYQEYLLKNGVNKSQIISINFEDGKYLDINNYIELYNLINEKLDENKMNYIFLDEIQKIFEFERAIDSLYVKKNVDLYITGSNAYLLSSELATLLSGRYIQIKMLPLSFKEYVSNFPLNNNYERLYSSYLTDSSFPYALSLTKSKEIKQYLDGIYDSIILKDIMSRNKFSDLSMLQSVIRFMFDKIGNLVSTNKIVNAMVSSGRKISIHTIENYLESLTDSYIFYKVSRYDIKGKQYLKTGDKYYAADIGLRYNLLGNKKTDMGHILENVVYLELLRRGYDVYIGKVGDLEIDFIAINEFGEEYYQVAYTVKDEMTLARELKPLEMSKDHNAKYLLTMDIEPLTSHNGIKQINVLDWLLNK